MSLWRRVQAAADGTHRDRGGHKGRLDLTLCLYFETAARERHADCAAAWRPKRLEELKAF
jgi:hypothetical protein